MKVRKWTDRYRNEKIQLHRTESNVSGQRSENKLYLHMKDMDTAIGGEEEDVSKVGTRGIKITNSMVEDNIKLLIFI